MGRTPHKNGGGVLILTLMLAKAALEGVAAGEGRYAACGYLRHNLEALPTGHTLI